MFKKEIIKSHFNNIADNYDTNNEKLYWKLSDELLFSVLLEHLPKDRKISILELGAGTGEWAHKILKEYDNVDKYTLVDFSDKMLNQASTKLKKYKDKINLINQDIFNIKLQEKYDVVINIYVLPFIDDSKKLIKIGTDYLHEQGLLISVGENYYNGVALNILKNSKKDIEEVVNNKKGYLSKCVPKLRFDKMDDLINEYKNNNLEIKFKCGFPVLSPIGMSESLTGNNTSLSDVLLNNYDYIFNLEKNEIHKKDTYNRGKYICVIGEKNEKNINIKRDN